MNSNNLYNILIFLHGCISLGSPEKHTHTHSYSETLSHTHIHTHTHVSPEIPDLQSISGRPRRAAGIVLVQVLVQRQEKTEIPGQRPGQREKILSCYFV